MSRLRELFTHPLPAHFEAYQKPMEPCKGAISAAKLTLEYIDQTHERQTIETPLSGLDAFILRYKTFEGVVFSFDLIDDQDIRILQLQNSRRKAGYWLSTGLLIPELFGDHIEALARHTESRVRRLSLPLVREIDGIEFASEASYDRYFDLIKRLQFDYSREEKLYVKDIPR
jgi:hypothetical protein